MKLYFRAALIAIAAITSSIAVHAQTPAFSSCGTYGAYVMLYKNTDQFEELGKLRCGEKLEVLSRYFDYLQVRTADGKIGWVRAADVTGGPASPSPQPATPFGLTSGPADQQRAVAVPLSNKDILSMQARRLPADVIVAKIKSSPSNFDTSATALQRLKFYGVSDKVIVAMVEAPSLPATVAAEKPAAAAAAPAPDVVQVKVPDGTPVELETIEDLSSDGVREGTIIHLRVLQDVAVDGVTIFQKNADARARVYVITQPARMGKPGSVSWAMEDVTAVNGQQLPVTFAALDPSVKSTDPADAAVDDGTTWEFRKNKPTTMPANHRLRATTHGDITLKIPAAIASQPKPAVAAPTSSTTNNPQASPEPSVTTVASKQPKP
jgi:uncharacterized protein YgiM (DUF1202 family)